MQHITSTHNSTISLIRSLKNAKSRNANNLFICEGEHMLCEALEANAKIVDIIVDINCINKYAYILDKAENANIYTVPSNILSYVADTVTPQGILATVSILMHAKNGNETKIIALDGIQDPGNVGTIIRTADSAGFDMVCLSSKCADIYNQKTLRASMGSVFHINCVKPNDFESCIINYRKNNYDIYGAFLDGDDFYDRERNNKNIVLIIGNEGSGISDEIGKLCNKRYKLPMQGKAESLNAAIAASIMMYDIQFNK